MDVSVVLEVGNQMGVDSIKRGHVMAQVLASNASQSNASESE